MHKLQAILYAFANKFLKAEDLTYLKGVISLTLLGQMLREDAIAESEERQSMLFKKMKADDRIADYHKGMEDRDYLHTLYEEYGLM